MPSYYIECNKCGDTFSGDKRHPNGLGVGQSLILREEALEAGWVGPMDATNSVDYCPKCQTEPQPDSMETK